MITEAAVPQPDILYREYRLKPDHLATDHPQAVEHLAMMQVLAAHRDHWLVASQIAFQLEAYFNVAYEDVEAELEFLEGLGWLESRAPQSMTEADKRRLATLVSEIQIPSCMDAPGGCQAYLDAVQAALA